ncbi:MAG TPA: YbjN domain-containing protein [Hyphomonadaceae bacterium]|jgi:hypothetical protein
MLHRRPNGFRSALALAAVACALISGASAQTPPSAPPSADRVRGGMFDASDPAGIVRFMEKTGYRVELATDTRGDPVISGRISRTDYLIQFYECEGGQFCNSVQFIAQSPRPAAFTAETANSFNARWRYVRLTWDAAQIKLQMDVNLDAGVTADNLEDTLDIWKQLIEIYERDILGVG